MGLIVPQEVSYWHLAQRSEPKTAEEYALACEFDFEAMKPYLLPGDVLDIGCGIGGPSALIAKHCGGQLHLLDGTGNGQRRANYGPHMDPYNDREATEALLRANGIDDFHWWPVGAMKLPEVQNVVSLISWGWHYPVSTYLKAVERALPIGGRLILDLRPGHAHELARSFVLEAAYQGFGKCNKTVWTRV